MVRCHAQATAQWVHRHDNVPARQLARNFRGTGMEPLEHAMLHVWSTRVAPVHSRHVLPAVSAYLA